MGIGGVTWITGVTKTAVFRSMEKVALEKQQLLWVLEERVTAVLYL